MQHVIRYLVFLIIAALATTPDFAAELRTTGFIDNVFPHWERNISNPASDNDTTRNHDSSTWGRTRGRMFFNFLANDDLRGVLGIELDAVCSLLAAECRRGRLHRGGGGVWLRGLRLPKKHRHQQFSAQASVCRFQDSPTPHRQSHPTGQFPVERYPAA